MGLKSPELWWMRACMDSTNQKFDIAEKILNKRLTNILVWYAKHIGGEAQHHKQFIVTEIQFKSIFAIEKKKWGKCKSRNRIIWYTNLVSMYGCIPASILNPSD